MPTGRARFDSEHAHTIRDSLAGEPRSLTPLAGVRIPLPEPIRSTRSLARILSFHLREQGSIPWWSTRRNARQGSARDDLASPGQSASKGTRNAPHRFRPTRHALVVGVENGQCCSELVRKNSEPRKGVCLASQLVWTADCQSVSRRVRFSCRAPMGPKLTKWKRRVEASQGWARYPGGPPILPA